MREFAQLLESLSVTSSRLRKLALLSNYFCSRPDPERGLALAALTGELSLPNLRPALLKELTKTRVDELLFDLSYDFVGDLAETIALIWPAPVQKELLLTETEEAMPSSLSPAFVWPSLPELVHQLETLSKEELLSRVAELFDRASVGERWALIKLATGGLRVGVSARLAKTALSQYSGESLEAIEAIWHGQKPPYEALFAWLDGAAPQPVVKPTEQFHSLMLAHPLDEDKDLGQLVAEEFQAEWKWDGIRVQLVLAGQETRIYSRTGDEITASFPDLAGLAREFAQEQGRVLESVVLDGELLVGESMQPLPFHCLQQRLNRKRVLKKHLAEFPAFVRVYDLLFLGEEDLRELPLTQRRQRLQAWLQAHGLPRMDLSAELPFASWSELAQLRLQGAEEAGHEGVIIKLKQSPYLSGRPKGFWYKWKRDAQLVDAVILYAQRGHGRRSSYYSDFTFGVWKGEPCESELVPIGKAYSGFANEELLKLDKFVREHTLQQFGPVREVEKKLVVEVAFDAAQPSPRHKSGLALRFPRIVRICWDKPVEEVLKLERLKEDLGI